MVKSDHGVKRYSGAYLMIFWVGPVIVIVTLYWCDYALYKSTIDIDIDVSLF